MGRNRMLVAAGALLAAVSTSASARNDAPGLPEAWQPQGPTPFEQLVAARGSWMPAGAFQQLLGELIAAGAGSTVIPDAEFVFPSRVGDLDGDGANDVATAEFAGEQSALALRRGTSGEAMKVIEDAFNVQTTDLDGDGTRELLMLSSSSERLTDQLSVIQQRVDLMTLDEQRWTYEVPGAILRAADYEGGVAADVEFVIGLTPMGDATGDGIDDVMVATASFLYVDSEVFVELDAVTARVIDGASGLLSGAVTTTTVNGFAFVAPIGDVSGDGLADIITLGGASADTAALTARASTGAVHWTTPIPTLLAYPTVLEMNGDAVPDVMLQAFTADGGQRLAYSGSDGSPLWQHPDRGFTAGGGDIDGDGGLDIIQVDAPPSGIVATAWSGADGSAIWGPISYPAPEGAWVVNCICTDDLNGDGIWDPMTADVVFGEPPTVALRTLDGSTGLPMWTADADPFSTFPVPIGADIDGDGGIDLGTASSTGSSISARILRGVDYTDLWSVTAAIEGSPLGFYADDLNADGGAELMLASVRSVGESPRGAAHALDTEGIIWSVG